MSVDERLIDLLMRYEELQEKGESVTLEQLCRDCPELLEEVRRHIQGQSAFWKRFGSTAPDREKTGPTLDLPARPDGPAQPVPVTPGKLRYQRVQFHAAGGLGEVHLAQDGELPRQVALKRMKPHCARDASSRQRFLLEAEVTALLEHPGIVPVYGLVHDDDGQPCYAMRFIRGDTLRSAIDRFHEADRPGRDPGERTLALRQLLNQFVSVCNTVAYAHSRNILHRDLKPGNVMLGPYGETLVVDWGLAKPQAQVPTEQTSGEEWVSARLSNSREGSTRIGDVLGTPLYSSPEQASGQWHVVGPTSDIYSLGAMLYILLTGRPPFGGRNDKELLDRVRRGLVIPLREVKRGVPRPLEAICLKAMAKDPKQRYPTARELADDVEHWLADEPVSAYAESPRERLGRWTRRHRAWVQALAAALVLVTLAATLAAFLINQARLQAEAARHAEAQAKSEAARRFKEALLATDKWTTGVSLVLERYYPDVPDAREQLLEAAAEDYERWAAEKSDDPELRLSSGYAFLRLGDIRRRLTRYEQAQRAHQQAEAIFAELAASAPDVLEYRLALANSRMRLGIDWFNLNRPQEAEASYQSALEDLQKLVADNADHRDCRDGLGTGLVNFSTLLAQQGRLAEAEKQLRTATVQFEALVQAAPDVARYRQGLATTRTSLGQVLKRQGQTTAALAIFRDEVRVQDDLVKQHPNRREYREDRAETRLKLGSALRTLGLEEDEVQAYQQAIADYQTVPNQPGPDAYRDEGVAAARIDLGQVLCKLGRTAEARQELQAAIAQLEALERSYPDLSRYREDGATAQDVLGLVLADLGNNADAEKAHRAAMAVFEKLVQPDKDKPPVGYRVARLAVCGTNLGRLLHKLGRHAEAEPALRESIRRLLSLSEEPEAGLPSWRNDLAESYTYLGDLLWDLGRKEEAAKLYQAVLEERTKLAETVSDPEYLNRLSAFLTGCRAPQFCDPARAVEEARKATTKSPQSASSWSALGAAHCQAKAWKAVIEALEQAGKLRPYGNGSDAFLLAIAHRQAGNPHEARQNYDRAVAWMEKNRPDNPELKRLRSEAAALLGQPVPKPAEGK